MTLRREDHRMGWFIYSGGRPWDGWAYPTEDAALKTAERCNVANASVIHGFQQGYVDGEGGQHSQKMLYDSKQRRRQ